MTWREFLDAVRVVGTWAPLLPLSVYAALALTAMRGSRAPSIPAGIVACAFCVAFVVDLFGEVMRQQGIHNLWLTYIDAPVTFAVLASVFAPAAGRRIVATAFGVVVSASLLTGVFAPLLRAAPFITTETLVQALCGLWVGLTAYWSGPSSYRRPVLLYSVGAIPGVLLMGTFPPAVDGPWVVGWLYYRAIVLAALAWFAFGLLRPAPALGVIDAGVRADEGARPVPSARRRSRAAGGWCSPCCCGCTATARRLIPWPRPDRRRRRWQDCNASWTTWAGAWTRITRRSWPPSMRYTSRSSGGAMPHERNASGLRRTRVEAAGRLPVAVRLKAAGPRSAPPGLPGLPLRRESRSSEATALSLIGDRTMTRIELAGVVVEATDLRNWRVTAMVEVDPAHRLAKNAEREITLGFFPTLDSALSRALQHRLRDCDARSVAALRDEVVLFRAELARLFEVRSVAA